MDCVSVTNSAGGGRVSVWMRSLWVKAASFAFDGGESVSMVLAIGVSKISGVPSDSIFYLQELTQCRWERRHQFLPGKYLASGAKSGGSDATHDPIPVFEQIRAAGIE